MEWNLIEPCASRIDRNTSSGKCRVCLEVKNCKSIYTMVLEKYLPSVIEFICGTQLSALDEPESLICVKCAMALIQAENIIQKFLASQDILAAQKRILQMKEVQEQEVYGKQNENFEMEELQEQELFYEFIELVDDEKPIDTYDEESEMKSNDRLLKSTSSACKQRRRFRSGALTSAANRTKDFHFYCDMCPFESDFAKYFRNHMTEVHNIEKPRIFKCKHCSEAYMEHRSLQNHIAHVHECVPRKCTFLCSQCGKGFGKHSHLVRHSYVHNPEKRPFRCDFCPMLFVNRSSVQRHMVASHSDVKPFTCEICGKAFGVIYGLRAHLKRVHTSKGHQCPNCKTTFRLNKSLEYHLLHDCHKRQRKQCAI